MLGQQADAFECVGQELFEASDRRLRKASGRFMHVLEKGRSQVA